MKKDNKIPLSALRDALQERMNYEEPEKAFDALYSGWMKHPKFVSPARSTMRVRQKRDGFLWFKAEEIPSFAAYCGISITPKR